MVQLNTPMEILKLLEKSNCRQCGELTCLAFAAAVFKGQKRLDGCPRLDQEVLERLAGKPKKEEESDREFREGFERLRKRLSNLDFPAAAQRTGGRYANGKLTLKILGKDFSVDTQGNFFSDIHIHHWITIPVLNYIFDGAGIPVSGKWVPFRELKNGGTWGPLFNQRCEKPLKRVADIYTDFFEDMIRIFNGRQVENHYASDISLVLHPLPKVPMLICYWKPDEGLESSLNLFFDSTAEDNLPIESLFALGTGLTRMFEKIGLTHG
ncbi:MAG: DUF3786 domain-containing protein [Deltaproteobacteria bacterium]|nr:DUF3786 domain-containing protein [Deltaproteobacteria bacterium]